MHGTDLTRRGDLAGAAKLVLEVVVGRPRPSTERPVLLVKAKVVMRSTFDAVRGRGMVEGILAV